MGLFFSNPCNPGQATHFCGDVTLDASAETGSYELLSIAVIDGYELRATSTRGRASFQHPLMCGLRQPLMAFLSRLCAVRYRYTVLI
jgi:hypothetical protein